MDGNKDDAALKRLNISKDAIEARDRSRASKLEKARRLDPSLPIDDLVSDLNIQAEAEDSPRSPNPSLRRQRRSSSTEEQRAIVREIKSKKDYYEILGLANTCSLEDLRKAYRKLSLKVHPDKNKAPGSEEAFKSVSKAFQCLSNEDARRNYDVSGSDEPTYQPRRQHNGDEIFRSFFFGGGGSFNRRANQASDTGFNPRVILQILPIVFLLLLSFLPSPQPIYSLSATHPYEHKFTTRRGVNYFVRSDKFVEEYPVDSSERQRIEAQVDGDYLSALGQHCRNEIQRQHWGYVRETPHCDMMRRFTSAGA